MNEFRLTIDVHSTISGIQTQVSSRVIKSQDWLRYTNHLIRHLPAQPSLVFSSSIFLFLFLPAVIALHFVAGTRFRNTVLLISSLFFYAWGEGKYVLVMLFCIASSWFFGRCLSRTTSRKQRLRLLWIGIGLNLLPLLYFKYAHFLKENVNELLHWFEQTPVENETILLPIGISFFTFQALSYLIDVYRKECQAQPSIFNLGLYISLFPQLIAGPIVRYRDVNTQINHRRITLSDFVIGSERFIYGLAKKVLIANQMGAMADRIFALPPGELTIVAAWLGIVCYALQIYFDFSGYSSMAIGLGRIFGFRFLENFNYPYVSRSIREFWRRWHISLSNWFRDYVYIPLGGNRGSTLIVTRNLFLVFLLCGLWHGAAWNFIIWGLLHGLFLVLERGPLGRWLERMPRILQHIYVLFFVLIAWVFFRATDMNHAISYLSSMFNFSGSYTMPAVVFIRMDDQFDDMFLLALLLSTPVYAVLLTKVNEWVTNASTIISLASSISRYSWAICLLILSAMEIAAGSFNPFIYFRF